MKIMKKAMAFFLCVVMTMAMGVSAFADGASYTISTQSGDTHTYEVYQILKGNISGGKLTDVEAGKNFNSSNGAGTSGANLSATDAANALEEVSGTDAQILEQVKKFVVLNKDNAYGTVTKDKALSVEPGYYLIKDVDNSLSGKDDAYTTYIVKVTTENITIQRKADKPTVEKKVKDVNDSKANSTTGWQDSADYDVNDAVPFQLTATLPVNATDFNAYKTYKLVFHDTESAGLTFNSNSVVVKYGDKTLATDQYTVTTNPSDKHTFDITINDVKSVKDADGNAISVAAGGKFTVEYTSTLNKNAVIGSTGNPNEVYLEYSNNPNSEGEGETGKTPEDKVIVFTYRVDVSKVAETTDGTPLAGAGFTLYKKDASGNWNAVGSEIKVSKQDDGSYVSSFLRVDDGDYKLVETTVPAGYSKANDVEFTISADHDVLSDNPQLTKLDGGTLGSGKVDTGSVAATVVNKSGKTLPSTGGMGTTLFYVVGGLMMAGAAVLLVTKKRMA